MGNKAESIPNVRSIHVYKTKLFYCRCLNTFDCYMYDYLKFRPCAVARSEACPLGMQAAPSLTPTPGTFFRGELALKKISFKKSGCQLLAKECARSTGKLSRRRAQEQCG